ncbi:single-stranded-DNA-specific exonuclease RecJ [bacterium]|nr:single-stranded-DNA-specific exonuclease RecJ [bacterium]MBU1985017.1 single-stranded-DNA-specific exonuclease RecJ [bacterium]
MQAKWELVESRPHEEIERLGKESNIPYTIARILINRGIETPEQVERFFNPSNTHLHDPFLMADMDKAVERIIQALERRERIAIYGDYDVDGITAASMLYLFLKDLGGDVVSYIPDRQNEGYGISDSGIQELARGGAALIVSVDCGITSINEAKIATSQGIDLIITDHHEPGDAIPEALAVCDPKREDCGYPFKELSGVGVAYKITQGMIRRLHLDDEYSEKYLDLVALGSAADIVPLVDENRVFVKLGLEKINTVPEVGLASLIETACIKAGKIEVGDIVFGIAPRINAVGRLGSALRAVKLLTTRDRASSRDIAMVLEDENRRRKDIDNTTLEEAVSEIERTMNPADARSIVLARDGWHPGVIGIVASRLIERYYRPTVMITIENGQGKGSARAIAKFDIYLALKACSDLLEQFGGHKYAAGLTIAAPNIPAFRERFEQVCREMIPEEDLVPKVRIESEISLDEITPEVVASLKRFAPFGPKNNRPNFFSRGIDVLDVPRIVGSNHLKFRAGQGGVNFEAIGFNLGSRLPRLANGSRPIEMVYAIEENEYNNRKTIQLRIKDLR